MNRSAFACDMPEEKPDRPLSAAAARSYDAYTGARPERRQETQDNPGSLASGVPSPQKAGSKANGGAGRSHSRANSAPGSRAPQPDCFSAQRRFISPISSVRRNSLPGVSAPSGCTQVPSSPRRTGLRCATGGIPNSGVGSVWYQ